MVMWHQNDKTLPEVETPVLVRFTDGAVRIGALFWDHPGFEDTYRSYLYWDDPYNDGQCWEWHDIVEWCEIPTNSDVEKQLRLMIAVIYAGPHLYADDGELQDSRENPCIDFKRDSPELIWKKMQERSLKKYNDLNKE